MGSFFSKDSSTALKKADALLLPNIYFRIDDDVLNSLTYETDEHQQFLFGEYGKKGFWNHTAVMMSYIVKANPIEFRTNLIELFVVEGTNTPILSVTRLREGMRPEYICEEYFITQGTSFGNVVEFSKILIQAGGEYSFLWNNCRHFSGKLLERLRDRALTIKLPYDTKMLRKYYRRYPPAYQDKTKRGGYVSFSDLLQLYPLHQLPVATPPTSPSASSSGPSSPSSSSSSSPSSSSSSLDPSKASIAKYVSRIESQLLEEPLNLRYGDCLSVEMPDMKPFHHFAVYLGAKDDVLEELREGRASYLQHVTPPLNPAAYDQLIVALEQSTAQRIHIDHNGHSVGIRDFDTDFKGLYPGPYWKVTRLPENIGDPEGGPITELRRFRSLESLLRNVLPLLGRTVYNAENTCTCVAAAVYNVHLRYDPQIPFGQLIDRMFDKYIEKAGVVADIEAHAIFDRHVMFTALERGEVEGLELI